MAIRRPHGHSLFSHCETPLGTSSRVPVISHRVRTTGITPAAKNPSVAARAAAIAESGDPLVPARQRGSSAYCAAIASAE